VDSSFIFQSVDYDVDSAESVDEGRIQYRQAKHAV